MNLLIVVEIVVVVPSNNEMSSKAIFLLLLNIFLYYDLKLCLPNNLHFLNIFF